MIHLTTFGICFFKKYGLSPAHFHSLLGLVWQAGIKYSKVKSDLLTDIHMLLMVKKGGIS